jgi:general secretion pathway protein D
MNPKLSTPGVWLAFAFLAAAAPAQQPVPSPSSPPPAGSAAAARVNNGDLRFNFRGAPLETVLNYMSEAAGYIIVLESPIRGTIDMWSAQPVTREEAVNLLNLALNRNGYTARVQGRSLIVSSKDDAKLRNIPVRTGNDPSEIPETAELVMQIIPLRHIDAVQAARDLGPLFPESATVTANQDSNALVVTDTQINVRHIVTVVSALDTTTDAVSTMRVFRLENADPMEMASLLNSVFQVPTAGLAGSSSQARNAASRDKSGKARNASTRSGTTIRGTSVTAIADPRTFSVIVTAPREDMPNIAELVAQLDSNSARKQKVFVYTLENADVRQVELALRNLFQTGNARTTTSNQPDPLTTRAATNPQTMGPNISLGTTRR